MIIADLSLMRIECNVDEADISNVHPGENARLEFDAYPDTVFSGTVSEVGNAQRIETQSAESQSSGSQTPGAGSNISGTQAVSYTVKIAISEYKGNLKPDMSANVEIITASKKNALKVPIQAVIPQTTTSNASSSQGTTKGTRSSYVVFTVDKNRAVYRPVITGLFGEDEVEILKGITDGQVVITGPFSNLRLLKNNINVQQIKPSPDDSNKP
jgi:HlyD family secretion protein